MTGCDQRLESAAHHEAGHIVVAAVRNLPLRPEGLMVDPQGWGLACYSKEPEESDVSRERVVLATFAGFKSENRFRAESSYPLRLEWEMIHSPDWQEARRIIAKFSDEYRGNENVITIQKALEKLTAQIVEGRWAAIQTLALALLEKDWEPLKALKSDGGWAHEDAGTAKYVLGSEAVGILAECGIAAFCVSE